MKRNAIYLGEVVVTKSVGGQERVLKDVKMYTTRQGNDWHYAYFLPGMNSSGKIRMLSVSPQDKVEVMKVCDWGIERMLEDEEEITGVDVVDAVFKYLGVAALVVGVILFAFSLK